MKFVLKMRYLRHPYLIWRTFIRPLEEQNSKKHCFRLNEYNIYSIPLEEAIKRLFGVDTNEVVGLKEQLEFSGLLKHIKSCLSLMDSYCSGAPIGEELGMMLYMVIKQLKPCVVLETGVANGVSSSSFILKALSENSYGRLYSIDLHCREGVTVPLGKKLGWIIPKEIRDRWSLMLGESTKVLPRLLSKVGSIDIFLHDSRHLYRTMMSEYFAVWPYLNEGGLLISDDVIENDAFIDFADKVKLHPIVVDRMGVIKKIPVDIHSAKL